VRAVNLIPAEHRRATSAAGRSGGVVYVVLGVLAVAVLLAAAYAVTGKQISDRKADADRLNAEAQAAEARAAQLGPYEQFASLSRERVATVTKLAGGRFDWSHHLREVSRLVPKGVWLKSISGTTGPGVQAEGASSNPLRGAVAAPAFEVVGCTTGHNGTALLMARLRAMDGVQRVSLSSSEKSDVDGGAGGGPGAGNAGEDCRNGSDRIPEFNIVVFFDPASAAPPAAAGGVTTAATGTGK
jgi:Tfp pilus assembly protein PilN